MIARDGVVLEIRGAIKPWRVITGPPGTHAILETADGGISNLAVKGDRMTVATHDPSDPIIELFSQS
jgi:hypothetical protein